MKTMKTLMVLGLFSFITACSDNEGSNKGAKGDHVWKQQTDTLQTSKDAAKKLQEQLNQQQQKLNENN